MNSKNYLPSGTQRFCLEGRCVTGHQSKATALKSLKLSESLHSRSLKLQCFSC